MDPQVKKILEQRPPDQNTREWFHQRSKFITCSDFGTMDGMTERFNKDRTDILFAKCGKGPTFVGNDATKWGQKYEGDAIRAYSEQYDKQVHHTGLIPYMGEDIFLKGLIAGSPDGVTSDGILLEVKCPYNREIKDAIPDYYMGQIQGLLHCLQLKKCHFIQYDPRGMRVGVEYVDDEPMLMVTEVDRDDEWFKLRGPDYRKFWVDVLFYRYNGIDNHPEYEERMRKYGRS